MGKHCNGVPTDLPLCKESHAYCEGMEYRASDTALNAPKADNPFTAEGRPVEYAAWNLGWDAADGAAGGTIDGATANCCATRGLAVSA